MTFPAADDAFVAVQQNAPARGQIERQAKQRQQQEQAGKDGELRWTQDLNRGQQHEHGRGDAERQQNVEQQAGQRNQHHEDQAHGGDRHDPLGSGVARLGGVGRRVAAGVRRHGSAPPRARAACAARACARQMAARISATTA